MRKYLFLILSFIFIILFTNNVFALRQQDFDILFYNRDNFLGVCHSYDSNDCSSLFGRLDNVTRISIVNFSYPMENNVPYSIYATIRFETEDLGNGLPFRNDFGYIGNQIGTIWTSFTSTSRILDSKDQGDLSYTRFYTYSYSLDFTSNFNSSGSTFDIYFTNPGISLWAFQLLDYQFQNRGGSTADAINNQTNTIVNNNNSNTQIIVDSQGEIKDAITDDSIDNDTGTDFFDDFDVDDYGLSDIITLPLSTIQSLTSKSCVVLNVPVPFTNSNISLPCMTEVYQNYLPTVFSLWQTVTFGILSYYIALDIFRIVKGFKNPDEDKIEVLDL